MKEENVLATIRVALEESALQETAARHSRQTEECLSLPRFILAMRRGFSAEELAHVGGCVFCQKMVAMQWRLECPSLVTLARYKRGTLPHRYAAQEHLHECESCRQRLESPLVRALAAMGESFAVGALLPALVARHQAETRLPLLAQQKDDGLTIALQERDGKLMGFITTSDTSRAGQRLQVQLFDAMGRAVECVEHEMREGSYGCEVSIDFGPFEERVKQLGSACALTAGVLES